MVSGGNGFYIDNALAKLNQKVKPASIGKCATHVRLRLEAGGINATGHPVSAKDYGPLLIKRGFRIVNDSNYKSIRGDIAVMKGFTGIKKDHPHGHIQMYSGSAWISDFKQNYFWPGPEYCTFQPEYKIYRYLKTMKTKMVIPFVIATLMLFNNSIKAQIKPANLSRANEQVKGMLKDFYTDYITAIATSEDYEEKLHALTNKYCTKRLMAKIAKDYKEGLDYDPFIKAQDSDTTCLKTLSVKKEPQKANTYTVSYIESYDKKKVQIHLLVIIQNNDHKIDAVW